MRAWGSGGGRRIRIPGRRGARGVTGIAISMVPGARGFGLLCWTWCGGGSGGGGRVRMLWSWDVGGQCLKMDSGLFGERRIACGVGMEYVHAVWIISVDLQ